MSIVVCRCINASVGWVVDLLSTFEETTLNTNEAFIFALIMNLRKAGLNLLPGDASAIGAVVSRHPQWQMNNLVNALSAVLARNPEDTEIIHRTLEQFLPSLVSQRRAPAVKTHGSTEQSIRDKTPEKSRFESLRQLGRKLLKTIPLKATWPQHTSAIIKSASQIILYGAAMMVPFLILALLSGTGTEIRKRPDESCLNCGKIDTVGPTETIAGSDADVIVDATLASLAIGGLILLIWRAVMIRLDARRRRFEQEAAQQKGSAETIASALRRIHPIGDDTYFDVGEIGGKPKPFLPHERAVRIIEFFGYRQGEPDPRRVRRHPPRCGHRPWRGRRGSAPRTEAGAGASPVARRPPA